MINPTIRAYLRVSGDAQDTANQKHGVTEYININGWSAPVFVEDSVSSKVPWRERGIGKMILEDAQAGDIIVVAEITRLARSTLEVLEVLKEAAERGLVLHVAKSRLIMDGSIQSKITATILGLAGEIERHFIRQRTEESLARRKAQIATEGGFVSKAGIYRTSLGRPAGEAERLALDAKAAEIDKYRALGLGKRSIAKLLDCAPGTLYAWLDRRRPDWRG